MVAQHFGGLVPFQGLNLFACYIFPRALSTLSGVVGKSRIHLPVALYMADEVIAERLAPTFSPMPYAPYAEYPK